MKADLQNLLENFKTFCVNEMAFYGLSIENSNSFLVTFIQILGPVSDISKIMCSVIRDRNISKRNNYPGARGVYTMSH